MQQMGQMVLTGKPDSEMPLARPCRSIRRDNAIGTGIG